MILNIIKKKKNLFPGGGGGGDSNNFELPVTRIIFISCSGLFIAIGK